MSEKDFFDRAAGDIVDIVRDALGDKHRRTPRETVDSRKREIALYLRETFDDPGAAVRNFDGMIPDVGRGVFKKSAQELNNEVKSLYSDIHIAEAGHPVADHLREFRERFRDAKYNHLAGIYTGHDVHLDRASRAEGYMPLELVLCAAYAQASGGKGKERHAAGDAFNDQPILTIGRLLKSADGEAYQAIKKLREGLMMHRRGESEAALREMLGAINYIAATALLVAEEAHARDVADFARMQEGVSSVGGPIDDSIPDFDDQF